MGAGEEHPAFGKGIDIGRVHARMTAQAAGPVVEVIDGDEKHIGLLHPRGPEYGRRFSQRQGQGPGPRAADEISASEERIGHIHSPFATEDNLRSTDITQL